VATICQSTRQRTKEMTCRIWLKGVSGRLDACFQTKKKGKLSYSIEIMHLIGRTMFVSLDASITLKCFVCNVASDSIDHARLPEMTGSVRFWAQSSGTRIEGQTFQFSLHTILTRDVSKLRTQKFTLIEASNRLTQFTLGFGANYHTALDSWKAYVTATVEQHQIYKAQPSSA